MERDFFNPDGVVIKGLPRAGFQRSPEVGLPVVFRSPGAHPEIFNLLQIGKRV
jgi:hypothetical protein